MWKLDTFYFTYNVDKSLDQGKLKAKPLSNNNVVKEAISIAI